jgi:3D (Asp-Asp-Asp) domain-containing protein
MTKTILKLTSSLFFLSNFSYAKDDFTFTDYIKVTATAYTSSTKECDASPFLAAWRNKLSPKVPSIAVSRDLLEIGLTNGMKVHVEGLEGEFVVLDKMNKRWTNRIDIYMNNNRQKALKFGKRKLKVYWIDPLFSKAK